MSDSLILNLVLFLPLLGIGCLTQVPTDRPQVTRQLTLWMMIAQLALTAWLYFQFDGDTAALQFETRVAWIPAWGVFYHVGLDGFNVLLVLLTAFLGPIVVAGAISAVLSGRSAIALTQRLPICMRVRPRSHRTAPDRRRLLPDRSNVQAH